MESSLQANDLRTDSTTLHTCKRQRASVLPEFSPHTNEFRDAAQLHYARRSSAKEVGLVNIPHWVRSDGHHRDTGLLRCGSEGHLGVLQQNRP